MLNISWILLAIACLCLGMLIGTQMVTVPDCNCPTNTISLENQIKLNTITRELNSTNKILSAQQKSLFKNLNNQPVCDNTISDLEFLEEARKRFDKNNEWTERTDCSVLTNRFTDSMQYFGMELFTVVALDSETRENHKYNCVPFDVQTGILPKNEWERYTFAERILQ